jgi:hypothetical protein
MAHCLACCVLSEDLPQSDFKEFRHHSLKMNIQMILDGPTSRKPMGLNQVSTEARQLPHLYLSTNRETLNSSIYGYWNGNVRDHHHEWITVVQERLVTCQPRSDACCFPINLKFHSVSLFWNYRGCSKCQKDTCGHYKIQFIIQELQKPLTRELCISWLMLI